MTQIFDLIREGTKQRGRQPQGLQTGIIISQAQGRFNVSAGGISYDAESGIVAGLKPGDRVWLVLGRGTPKIVGLFGRDDSFP